MSEETKQKRVGLCSQFDLPKIHVKAAAHVFGHDAMRGHECQVSGVLQEGKHFYCKSVVFSFCVDASEFLLVLSVCVCGWLTRMVFLQGSWPLQVSKTSFSAPPEMVACQTAFLRFYESVHQGRRLAWLHHLGKAEVYVEFFGDC